MTATYSNRHFFRQTQNVYLAQYFTAKKIPLNFDVDSLKDKALDEWQSVLNSLPDAKKAETEADFQNINGMAFQGRGISALVDEAHFHDDSDFIETISTIPGFHAKAMWAFLNKPAYWRGAAMFLHADNVSNSYWKKRNDLPKTPPHVEDEDTEALAKAISQFFHLNEGRGKHCIVEALRRNHKEYFFAYPEDFAQAVPVWESGSLKSQAHHPAFEIIFVYCEAEGSLDIYAPKNTKALPDLQRMFAQNILKMATLENGKIDKRVYELSPVLDEDFEFKIDPASGISNVILSSLRVRLNQGKNRLVTLQADVSKDPDAVYTLLDELKLPPYTVSRISLKVIFEAVNGRRASTQTVNITCPNSCALGYDGNDLKIRRMLALSKIEPRAVHGD